MAKKGKVTKAPVELPEEIVDHLRAERGGVVDTAIETGRIKVVDKKKRMPRKISKPPVQPRMYKSNGWVEEVTQETIDNFLKIIPEPEWIEWKKARGEIIIIPEKYNQDPPKHIKWEHVLYLCSVFTVDKVKRAIDLGVFIVDLPY